MKPCKVDGCSKPSNALGLCKGHYYRLRKNGHTDPTEGSHGPIEDRFWRKVQKTSGCWLWTGFCMRSGYGKIRRGGKGQGLLLAHRLSYEMHHGPIGPRMFVMHTCDNPRCVNPDHLKQGTPQDNMLDMISKGRKVVPIGDGHFSCRLDAKKVRYIRSSNETSVALAEKFGVNPSAISNVRNGITWKHVK